jgi:dUTP pyrophosphatase
MKIEIKVLDKELYEEFGLPQYQTEGSAAIDLISAENVIIRPGETIFIKTGLAYWIGSAAQNALSPFEVWGNVAGVILPRSGLGSKQGLVLANLTGLIDDDYQNEILIAAWNRKGSEVWISDGSLKEERLTVTVNRGDRIAQMVFLPVIKPMFKVVEEFTKTTARGLNGWGSTGV